MGIQWSIWALIRNAMLITRGHRFYFSGALASDMISYKPLSLSVLVGIRFIPEVFGSSTAVDIMRLGGNEVIIEWVVRAVGQLGMALHESANFLSFMQKQFWLPHISLHVSKGMSYLPSNRQTALHSPLSQIWNSFESKTQSI